MSRSRRFVDAYDRTRSRREAQRLGTVVADAVREQRRKIDMLKQHSDPPRPAATAATPDEVGSCFPRSRTCTSTWTPRASACRSGRTQARRGSGP